MVTRAEKLREWRKKNKERVSETTKAYYHKNKDKLREYQNSWRADNPNYTGGNIKNPKDPVKNWIAYKLNSVKRNAKIRGIYFELTKVDIQDIIVTHCPILGIELDYGLFNKGVHGHNSPSLDRINPHLGYVKSNIRIVSDIFNKMKYTSTDTELTQYCTKITEYFNAK